MKKLIVLACVLFTATHAVYTQQSPTLHQGVAAALNNGYSAYRSQKPDFGAAIAVVDDLMSLGPRE